MINPILLTKLARSYLSDIDRVWKDSDKIKKYQDKRIRQLVKYAYTIPLYHDKYKKAGIHPGDIQGIKDIEKLPMVSKKILEEKSLKVYFRKTKILIIILYQQHLVQQVNLQHFIMNLLQYIIL